MLSNVLWNIFLGVIGGTISSVIVSRVFLLQNELQSHFDALESGLRKIHYLHGIIHTLKTVMQLDYDTDIDKHEQMKIHGYKSEDEYYASKKNARWIDAVELKKHLIKLANDEAQKIFDELRNLNIKGKESTTLLDTYVTYVNKIKSMQEAPFSLIDETSRLYNKAIDQFDQYKEGASKRLIKRVITDRTMIVLLVIVLFVAIGFVVAKFFGI